MFRLCKPREGQADNSLTWHQCYQPHIIWRLHLARPGTVSDTSGQQVYISFQQTSSRKINNNTIFSKFCDLQKYNSSRDVLVKCSSLKALNKSTNLYNLYLMWKSFVILNEISKFSVMKHQRLGSFMSTINWKDYICRSAEHTSTAFHTHFGRQQPPM